MGNTCSKIPCRLKASFLNPEVQEDLVAVTVKNYLVPAPFSCSRRSTPNHTWWLVREWQQSVMLEQLYVFPRLNYPQTCFTELLVSAPVKCGMLGSAAFLNTVGLHSIFQCCNPLSKMYWDRMSLQLLFLVFLQTFLLCFTSANWQEPAEDTNWIWGWNNLEVA